MDTQNIQENSLEEVIKGKTREKSEEAFYTDAKNYWDAISPTVDGMLGGFSHISSTDIGGSNKFLRQFLKGKGPNGTTESHRVLDCGAGIGRVSKLLLAPLFDVVDMVELSQGFLDKAPNYFGDRANKLGNLYCSGLQNFIPEKGSYDVIWSQWVLGHLKDEALIAFFQRCKEGLGENGIMVVKENVCAGEKRDFDAQDSSYTRPKLELLDLFERAGLKILRQEKQKNFPKEIYEVWMFALQ